MQLAKIHEIFTSIQGEGIFAGKRQLFIRFYGCNAACAYCDTPQRMEAARDYTIGELFEQVNRVHPADVHSVSLTGGEPLLQTEFLTGFLPILKKGGYRVFLETNGTLSAQLSQVIDYVDIVAMDIKLPTSTNSHAYWFSHEHFLDIAARKKVFVKVVISGKTAAEDVRAAAMLVANKSPYITFILQPVTPSSGVGVVESDMLDKFREIAERYLSNVKVIPQMHKLLGVR